MEGKTGERGLVFVKKKINRAGLGGKGPPILRDGLERKKRKRGISAH